ncbi:hypothetical protein [Chondromyces apiculatus]|uniref:hypothetical protein n=1 Tax=Chondromyces apiculatus TaxID=51 RepID=UPI0018CC0F7F|nr:hypothetical protein [Chondromyces apiculatus]
MSDDDVRTIVAQAIASDEEFDATKIVATEIHKGLLPQDRSPAQLHVWRIKGVQDAFTQKFKTLRGNNLQTMSDCGLRLGLIESRDVLERLNDHQLSASEKDTLWDTLWKLADSKPH